MVITLKAGTCFSSRDVLALFLVETNSLGFPMSCSISILPVFISEGGRTLHCDLATSNADYARPKIKEAEIDPL